MDPLSEWHYVQPLEGYPRGRTYALGVLQEDQVHSIEALAIRVPSGDWYWTTLIPHTIIMWGVEPTLEFAQAAALDAVNNRVLLHPGAYDASL